MTRPVAVYVRLTLLIAGLYQVATGIWSIVAPGSFFDTVGAFGVRNDHYLFDLGSFAVPLGLALLAAVRWPSWRVPALSVATLHWGLHAMSHLVDTNHHDGHAVGWLEFASLAVSTVLLAAALWACVSRPAT